ncbi:MAG: cell surface protein SprA [Bacteroidales bacterium]|nr:cell surface protein SprA [Bacteroidales bacterium]
MKHLSKTLGFAGAITLIVASIFTSRATNFDFNQINNHNKDYFEKPTIDGDTDRLSKRERRNSPIQLKQPSNLTTETEYDYKTGNYTQQNKIGDLDNGHPQSISQHDYDSTENKSEIRQYWRQQMMIQSAHNESDRRTGLERYLNPRINVDIKGFDRIFGTNVIDIKPQGNVMVTCGVDISKIDNFTLPKKQRNDVSFDFDMNMQVGVTGTIGDKMKIGINYNTEATFEFENKQNIEYLGHDDEIIQRIEFGNVSMPLEGTLIQGSSTLFGVKTDLKFGKLTATAVLSQQKGETKTIEVNSGAVTNEFSIQASDYEANRHFFLNHFFRDNYERALANLPLIQSGINITNIEVWVTNDKLATENTRNSVAFLDLAEPSQIYNTSAVHTTGSSSALPSNNANNLYAILTGSYKAIRDINSVTSTLNGRFTTGTDYEKIGNARKLNSNEYSFNSQLGFISLNSSLQDDEVLAVAYEYTYKGKTYKVGEFSTEVNTSQTLILKLLRGTSFSPALPNWKLMMKNVYSLNAYQVSSEDFRLQIKYHNDKTGTELNYLNAGDIDGKLLLKVLNLDNTNSQLESTPDGLFDFIEGVTINADKGRIYLPELEPFGSYLEKKINDKAEASKYCFNQLYDSTKTIAKQNAERDKFYIVGKYKSSSGSEISLDAMNIPEGSVKVTCGGLQLKEGSDYVVDYLLGSVKILNESILSSGNKILVSVESNTTFSSTTKTLLGTHLNYQFNKNFNIGGTIMRLSEKTLTNKVNFGNEPIKNTIWGLDARYTLPMPYLTNWIDKLPLISTKAESKLSFEGEFAQLIPGHSRSIDRAGTCYIDDFESAQTKIDVKTVSQWVLASTPGGTKRFPEASLNNDIRYGFNRAKLAWYNVLSDLQGTSTSSYGITPSYITKDDQSNHYVRAVYEKEIFPNAQSISGISTQLTILNLAYYPSERGPYNYDVEGTSGFSAGINEDGSLKNPSSRWAGIMREMTTTDFEASNIEYIEFWMMDPFIYEQEDMGVDLYFNLGNVSEDVLKDSRKSFENGLPFPADPQFIDTTSWGLVSNKTFLVNAFDNTNGAKEAQDLGFDGLKDEDERSFFSDYLDRIANLYGTSSQAYADAYNDPSSDNYHFFRGSDYDEQKLSILDRYKNYNGTEGNSCDFGNSSYSTIKDRYPDVEDINLDNTLSETESYYQYKIHLSPNEMQVGQNYITDMIESNPKTVNGETSPVKWYQFKVPIYEPDSIVGSISDFKSIRFMRMYLTNAVKDIILRFAEMDLVRGDWRKYNYAMTSAGEVVTDHQFDDGLLDISTVSLEENGSKTPVNYLLPPGIDRERDYQTNQVVEEDEKSMSLHVTNLPDGQSVAAYKTAVLDLRQYKKLKMFVHEEQPAGQLLNDNDLSIFVRLGSDYKENYYEYELPLKVTPDGYYADDDNGRLSVWPLENNVEIVFSELQEVKLRRNNLAGEFGSTVSITMPYTVVNDNGTKITVMGNPNMSNIKTIMIGVRNPSQETNVFDDDGLPKTAEIWVNELRLTDFNEDGGWATKGKVELQMADLANVAVSGYIHTPGFGSLEKRVSERYQETVYQYDITSQLQLGKFFNKDYGVKMPLYFGYSENYEIPRYNPLDPDIELSEFLNSSELSKAEKDKIREQSITFERRKSFNLTNVRVEGRSQEAKDEARARKEEKNAIKNPNQQNTDDKNDDKDKKKTTNKQKPFYHVSNFTAGFAYSEYYMHDVTVKSQLEEILQSSLEYNYTYNPKNYKPFSKVKVLKTIPLIKDFNFYLLPTMVAVSGNIDRSYSQIHYRNINEDDGYLDPCFQKDFGWRRNYELRYKLSQGLSMNFSANNESRVNPDGQIDRFAEETARERDTLFMNFLDLGYNTNYKQTVKFQWQTPINKIPGLKWTSANAIYNSDYEWNRGIDPVEVQATDTTPSYYINHGNTISNNGVLTLNGSLNFESLYRKMPYFKNVLSRFGNSGRKNASKEKKEVNFSKGNFRFTKGRERIISHNLGTTDVEVEVLDIDGQPVSGDMDVVDKNKIRFIAADDVVGATVNVKGKKDVKDSPLLIASDYLAYTLMSVRSVSVTYKNQRANTLTGYQPGTKILGMENANNILAPGFEYLMSLNNDHFHITSAERGWLLKDSTLADPVLYTKGNSIGVRVALEPINTFRIDVSFDRSIIYNTEDFFSYASDIDGWQTSSRVKQGNYRISYNMLKTSFKKVGDDYSLQTYNKFLESREIIAQRQADRRIGINNYDPTPAVDDDGNLTYGNYPNGYSATHQDVLIPAFLSAYAGSKPNKIMLDPFLKFPLPNWRINYKGLGNIPFLKDIVRSAMLTHAYTSTYSISSFKNNADYSFSDEENLGRSFARYEANDLFIPQYEIASVTLEEKFAPLAGIDISWVNLMSTKFEYRRTRQITLGLANSQISEIYRKEYIIGLGYKFAQLPINIRTSSGSNRFKSDLDLRMDLVIDDDKTILREIENLYDQISAGQRSFSIKSTADYRLSQRFKVQLYYNHQITNPLISTSYRTSNIKFGFSISMSLD